MSQGGRICRKVGRGTRDADLEIELDGDAVRVRRGGRLIATLTGRDADDVRESLDDPERLERVVARKVR